MGPVWTSGWSCLCVIDCSRRVTPLGVQSGYRASFPLLVAADAPMYCLQPARRTTQLAAIGAVVRATLLGVQLG